MLTLSPNQTINVLAHTYDLTGDEDVHDLLFSVNNDVTWTVTKTGLKTFSLRANTATEVDGELYIRDAATAALVHTEVIRIDDTTIAAVTLEILP